MVSDTKVDERWFTVYLKSPQYLAGAPLVHAPFPDAMREYLLDESKPLPMTMAICYWVYPAMLHVFARGFGVNDLRSPG